MAHNFEDCSLRSSSLLIVDSKTQKILLATKEICSLFGFLPSQIIRHNLAILNLQYIHEHRYLLRHETSHSLIALDVCIHHENTIGLDYWFLKPISTSLLFSNTNNINMINNNNSTSNHNNNNNSNNNNNNSNNNNNNNNNNNTVNNINVLRLNTYGCIEYTSMLGEERKYVLGKSLKSLIHKDDQQRLLDGFNERQTTYQVLYLRWQILDKDETIKENSTSGIDEDKNNNNHSYEWISLTMMTVSRRRSYGAQHEDLARQLCIIRPMIDPHMIANDPSSQHPHHLTTTSNTMCLIYHLLSFSPFSSSPLSTSPSSSTTKLASSESSPSSLSSNIYLSKMYLWFYYLYQVNISLFGYCLGLMVEGWWCLCDIYYQGQCYMVEFFGHLLISLLDFLADCIDPAPSSTSSVRVVLGEPLQQHNLLNETSCLSESTSNPNTTEVPWFRPLHRKRWATAVRTLRKCVQSNTMAQKSLGVLETLGVVQSESMFDYLEKVTSEHYHPPNINDKTN
ncbi:unnamed protein product [Cunninghamella blakesleeana]